MILVHMTVEVSLKNALESNNTERLIDSIKEIENILDHLVFLSGLF